MRSIGATAWRASGTSSILLDRCPGSCALLAIRSFMKGGARGASRRLWRCALRRTVMFGSIESQRWTQEAGRISATLRRMARIVGGGRTTLKRPGRTAGCRPSGRGSGSACSGRSTPPLTCRSSQGTRRWALIASADTRAAGGSRQALAASSSLFLAQACARTLSRQSLPLRLVADDDAGSSPAVKPAGAGLTRQQAKRSAARPKPSNKPRQHGGSGAAPAAWAVAPIRQSSGRAPSKQLLPFRA